MTPEEAAALREPFKPEQIGQLPKAGIMLDFVGHGVTTGRLLDVDPEWSWEPMARDEHGSPALDAEGNLWILLTVAGVTRPGVGDGRNMKERIGDALRNASMRFGVALDLWSKQPLQIQDYGEDPQDGVSYDALSDEREATVPMTASQQSEIARLSADLAEGEKGDLNNWWRAQGLPKRIQLTKDQADEVIFRLNELVTQKAAERQPVAS